MHSRQNSSERMNGNMADKKIYWHLPGFCYFRLLNQVLMNLMKDYPDCFEEKYCIGSVYGTFPGAVWNGDVQYLVLQG